MGNSHISQAYVLVVAAEKVPPAARRRSPAGPLRIRPRALRGDLASYLNALFTRGFPHSSTVKNDSSNNPLPELFVISLSLQTPCTIVELTVANGQEYEPADVNS